MKIKHLNHEIEILETKKLVNNWEEYTGRFITWVRFTSGERAVAFDLPGRGGRVTQKAARRIHELWRAGKSAQEIANAIIGCSIRY